MRLAYFFNNLFSVILDLILVEKFLDDVHVYAMPHVKERLVVYNLLSAVYHHVFVDHIEAQMQVFGQTLHSVYDAVGIEEGTAALSS